MRVPIELRDLLWNVFAAGGGGALIAFLLFRKLGESWLDKKFSEGLEAFRHAKAAELEKLRAEVDGSLRAKVRLQEREFLVLSDCWDLMNVAFGLTQSFVSPMQSYQDLEKMSPEMRREYVNKLDVLESQKSEILTSANPTKEFIRISTLIKKRSANNAVIEFSNYVYRNEIFLDEEIAEDFKSVSKSLHSAVRNMELPSELKETRMLAEPWEGLENNTHPMILKITAKLRSRIGSHRPAN